MRVLGVEQPTVLARSPAAGLIGVDEIAFGGPDLEYRIDDFPGPADLVIAHEQRVTILDHIQQQRLIGIQNRG